MMIRRLTLGCLLAFAGLGMLACDETTPTTDAGPMSADTGPGGTDSAMMMMGGDVLGFGPRLADLTPADFSCRGSLSEPDRAMTAVSFTGVVTDFFTGMPVEGLTVEFFGDNTPVRGCAGDCIEVVSDGSGGVTLMDNEGSWYAYRIPPGTGIMGGAPLEYIELMQFNEATPAAGGSEALNTVQADTRNTIVTLLGVTVEAGTATLTGRLADCNGENIANATVRVFDSGGEISVDGTDVARSFYFNGTGLPAATQMATHIDGLYGATNIPVRDGTFRVEIWGVTTAGGSSEMLGCESGQITGDGITVFNVGPDRMDGPSDCSM